MPLNIALDLLVSLFQLLAGSFALSIPVFLIVLAAAFVHRKLVEKTKLSWVKGAVIVTYAAMLVFMVFFYLAPFIISIFESQVGPAPPEFELTFQDQLALSAREFFKVFAMPIVLAILLLPFEFLSALVLEAVEKKYKLPHLANVFIAVFVSVAAASLIILTNSWILNGIIYLVYWS